MNIKKALQDIINIEKVLPENTTYESLNAIVKEKIRTLITIIEENEA